MREIRSEINFARSSLKRTYQGIVFSLQITGGQARTVQTAQIAPKQIVFRDRPRQKKFPRALRLRRRFFSVLETRLRHGQKRFTAAQIGFAHAVFATEKIKMGISQALRLFGSTRGISGSSKRVRCGRKTPPTRIDKIERRLFGALQGKGAHVTAEMLPSRGRYLPFASSRKMGPWVFVLEIPKRVTFK